MSSPILESDNIFNIDRPLVPSSSGKRFANYLIDIILFYLFFFAFGIFAALFFPESIDELTNVVDRLGFLDNIISLVLYAVYMGVMETIFKGRSIGKFITGTIAVRLDGHKLTAKDAFARGFCRAVPFCVFSALGNPCQPWQDKWTNTVVVDKHSLLD